MMKFVIAPDSFKESMSAIEDSLQIQEAIHDYDASFITQCLPLADGGEGTLETLMSSLSGQIKMYEVTGVCFEKRSVPIAIINDCAIIECAKVCGLELLDEQHKNPYLTTTYGLGELILKALDLSMSRIMICLGGSATNDGGIGLLMALGVQFLDCHHQPVIPTMKGLKDIEYIDWCGLDQRLKDVELIGVCDVSNPLCGKQGATYVYGPQKGLHLDECESIDQAMQRYAQLIEISQPSYQSFPGAGAAGGLGYALLLCGGHLERGFEVVSRISRLEDAIASCDCVIVGEGKMDYQTQYGKTPYGVLQIAKKYHKKVYAFCGRVEDLDVLQSWGFENVWSITPTSMPLAQALQKGKENLKQCVFTHMEEMLHGI